MKLLPRRAAAAEVPDEPADVVPASTVGNTPTGPKGRPTPKRRDTGSQRGPAAPPPRTRKEAYRRQKEQTARAKATASGPTLSREAHREALRRGDASVLPRRDQGPLKALARDYVDTRPMLSNYLLLAFVPIVLGPVIGAGNKALASGLQLSTFAILIVVLVEWYLTGNKLRKLGRERGMEVSGSALSLGFYAGSRAYLPRRWRLPKPRKARGDQI